MQRHKISKLVSAAAALARSDARVQHRNIQFGKGPGMHLQVVSAARERLVMKKATTRAVCSPGAHAIQPRKRCPKIRKFCRETHRDLREIVRAQSLT